MSDSSNVPDQLPYRLVNINPEELRDPVHALLKYIIQTELKLSKLSIKIAETPLSPTGYSTQKQLKTLGSTYAQLTSDVDRIHRVMATLNLKEIPNVDSVSRADQDQLLDCIGTGDVQPEVSRLIQLSGKVGQQLESNTIAANSRMILTASSVAVAVAVLSFILA